MVVDVFALVEGGEARVLAGVVFVGLAHRGDHGAFFEVVGALGFSCEALGSWLRIDIADGRDRSKVLRVFLTSPAARRYLVDAHHASSDLHCGPVCQSRRGSAYHADDVLVALGVEEALGVLGPAK